MFLVFYRLKYPAAQHLEGHEEFTEKSLDLWPWLTLNFASKDHTTLAQQPRHMTISRRCYGHFFISRLPSIQLGVCNFVERCKLPQFGMERRPSRQRLLCMLGIQEQCRWQLKSSRC